MTSTPTLPPGRERKFSTGRPAKNSLLPARTWVFPASGGSPGRVTVSASRRPDGTRPSKGRSKIMAEKPSERIEITSFDGHRFDGFLYRPAQTPAPGIVMIPEIYGLTRPLRETATRFSNEGFAVVTLDIFSRFRPGVV